jgi:lactoylglutathione lyase
MEGADVDYGQPVINHLGQCTADLAVARRFYVEVLGFVEERELTVPDDAAGRLLQIDPPVGLRAVYVRRGNFVLELMQFERPGNPDWVPRAFNEPGLTHLSISVPDLPATVARVAEYGGRVETDLGVAAIVRDPDGQIIELLPMEYRMKLDGA